MKRMTYPEAQAVKKRLEDAHYIGITVVARANGGWAVQASTPAVWTENGTWAPRQKIYWSEEDVEHLV